jgi:hypothetical protein
MSRAALLQFLVALAFAACQSGSAKASDTGSDCLIHHDAASAIACYRQITEGMKEDTSWCQGRGLKAVQELQANIRKGLNQVLEHRRKIEQAEVSEFGNQATKLAKDIKSTTDPARQSQLAAWWDQLLKDRKRKKEAKDPFAELQQIHNEFGKLQTAAGRLDCR